MITHLELAELSQKSYSYMTHSIMETDAYIITRDDCVIIAFAGTETVLWPWYSSRQAWSNWRDVRNNLKFIRKVHPEFGRVHRGFLAGAVAWTTEFKAQLPKDCPIYVTGHSKGAAEGAQVARILKTEGFDIREVVLFAEPAGHYIGSRKHYDSLGLNTTTYINGNDIIEYMPPWGRQSADITYIGDRGVAPSVSEHFMVNYIKTMKDMKPIEFNNNVG